MSEELIQVVVQIAALLFAVSAHESAHGWVALRCGDSTAHDLGRISLNPLRHIDPVGSVVVPAVLALTGAPVFGWARPVPVSLAQTRDPRIANLVISAAGPISNLLLAAIFGLTFIGLRNSPDLLPDAAWAQPFVLFLVYSTLINVILALFNLLPIPPLDGFGVLESVVPPSAYPLMSQARRWGFLLLLLVIFSGALGSILGPAQRQVLNWLLGP